MTSAVLCFWAAVALAVPQTAGGDGGTAPAGPTTTAAAPATTASAPVEAQALLERADAALGRASDAVFTIDVAVVHPDGSKVERSIRVWQKGRDQRMVKFLAPARLRGTGILLPDGERVLVYLPAYKRVREVTGREGGDAFLGTGFSIDELALVRLAPTHAATLAEEDAESWTLRLAPTKPDDHEHAALLLRMRKVDDAPTRVTYLNAKGDAYRVLEMGDFRSVDGQRVAHRISLQEPGEKRQTTAEVKEAALGQGIADDFFTERQLRRSP